MGAVALTEQDFTKLPDFIQAVRLGKGPLTCALGILGWSPAKYREMLRDAEFAEFMDQALEMRYESVVESLYLAANNPRRPSVVAQQVILYSQHGDRGWRPPAQRVSIDSTQRVDVNVRDARISAIHSLLDKLGVEALQPGGSVDKALEAGEVIDVDEVA